MKIHQLPMGARFEYEGEEYVKTGPMFATAKAGGQRLIPKYAVLRPLDAVVAVESKRSEMLARHDVINAFAAFYAACEALVPESQRAELDRARTAFRKAMGE